MVSGYAGGYRGTQGLAIGDDGSWVDGFCVDQQLVGGVGIFVEGGLAGGAIAAAVAAVFEGEDVGWRRAWRNS